jgi:hypothetical protein
MAILESRTQTGLSWVKESITLFKSAPRQWLLLALAYVGLFMILPSVLAVFGFISMLIWPVFLAVSAGLYRDAAFKKPLNLSVLIRFIQPKLTLLVALGAGSLLYSVIIGLVLSDDVQGLAAIAQVGSTNPNSSMTEAQMLAFMQKMLPVLLKMVLLLIPLLMGTWFSPMLIAFNDYPLIKAIKSSIAGSLQYMVAMGVAWLALSVGLILGIVVVGVLAGIFTSIVPGLQHTIMSFLMFGALLLATAMMLAFQYVSYRDVFRAA